MPKYKILVAIFTYNRGQFLENCVDSVLANFSFDFDLHIYDDNSTDKTSIETIEKLATKYTVIQNSNTGADIKLKGLYQNMNDALSHCYDYEFDYCIILQDDMQVVRPISTAEFSDIVAVAECESIACTKYLFSKDNDRIDLRKKLVYAAKWKSYIPIKGVDSSHVGLVDTGIFFIQKLKTANFRFGANEKQTLLESKKENLNRAIYKYPFVGFLPWPNTHRSGYSFFRKLRLYVLDRHYNTGFHPYKPMAENKIKQLFSSEDYKDACHGEYLETKSSTNLTQPYNFYDSWVGFKIRMAAKLKMKKWG